MSTAEAMPYRITESADLQREDFQKEEINVADYKMVTFSLGGRDYGINIMKVKEISKASRFTYVPNALPFVRGVYNLRGDIISIIDLRQMFNIPITEKPKDGTEQMIILRLEDNILGVIVDSIDKVVGVSSKSIQPPHPLFGDINIKFISGIVENDERLYIILDTEGIFSQKDAIETQAAPVLQKERNLVGRNEASERELAYNFISEGLISLRRFYVTSVNDNWFKERISSWTQSRERVGADFQLREAQDADEFLSGFYSPYTGQLWPEDYREAFKKLLPEQSSGVINVWNPGCGKGYETYSLATILKERYPGKRIKIWAHDNDLLEISTGPTLVVQKGQVPPCYDKYLVEIQGGFQFNSEIKESVVFEYHDATNGNTLPPIDLILCRDLVSFTSPENQQKLIREFNEQVRGGGLLVLGGNEVLNSPEWQPVQSGSVKGFRKK